jgi:hypothetical protein
MNGSGARDLFAVQELVESAIVDGRNVAGHVACGCARENRDAAECAM